MKIFYMMGKSSSGKDTIFNKLKEQLDVNVYVMYTTRPMREGEEDGITYHYITKEEMENYIQGKMSNQLIEERTYQTVHGPWIYATIKDEQFETKKNILMMGTLESYKKMKEYFGNRVVPIYIEVEDGIRLERALKREKMQKKPQYAELCRRFLADSKDFSEENIIKAGIEKRFENLKLDDCVKEIVQYLETRENKRTKEK